MLKLYYSPAAVSLASHFALEEAGVPYTLVRIDLKQGQHLTPEYRRIHPLSRVPVLELEPGNVLTETPALLWAIAGMVPGAGLLPQEAPLVARANEWMSLLASSVHPHFISFFRPQRYTDGASAQECLRKDGKKRFFELLEFVEQRLPDDGFSLGGKYSLCDAYLTVFWLWARHFELPAQTLPRYSRLTKSVIERPAIQRAIEQEGLGAMLSTSAR